MSRRPAAPWGSSGPSAVPALATPPSPPGPFPRPFLPSLAGRCRPLVSGRPRSSASLPNADCPPIRQAPWTNRNPWRPHGRAERGTSMLTACRAARPTQDSAPNRTRSSHVIPMARLLPARSLTMRQVTWSCTENLPPRLRPDSRVVSGWRLRCARAMGWASQFSSGRPERELSRLTLRFRQVGTRPGRSPHGPHGRRTSHKYRSSQPHGVAGVPSASRPKRN